MRGEGTLQADGDPRWSAAAIRLAAFNRVATDSVDAAAEAVGRIFCPHDLKPVHHASPDFYTLHNSAAFEGFSINYVAYGGSVSIDPGCLERFFLVQIPITGSARVRTAACEVATGPDRVGSLLSPTIPTRMTWQGDCAQLILLVERRLVEQRAAALAGTSRRTVEFDPAVDLETAPGRALQSQIAHLVDVAESLGPGRSLAPNAAADLREAILDGLLNGQRHGLSDAIAVFDGRAETLPRALKRVRDHLHAEATEPLDLAGLAAVAGIGIRALQLGFKRHFGTSISDMLLDIRLAHLNARLRNADPSARITDIAFDLGFTHLSRMASAYRDKFGETPSTTLRKPS
nr:AraC family transcriptional regulator [Bradyrhizobium prioritasuperba]